jgi:hypothetical protein
MAPYVSSATLPRRTRRLFEVGGEAFFVAQRGVVKSATQRAAQPFQPRKITGQRQRDSHIILRTGCGEFAEP